MDGPIFRIHEGSMQRLELLVFFEGSVRSSAPETNHPYLVIPFTSCHIAYIISENILFPFATNVTLLPLLPHAILLIYQKTSCYVSLCMLPSYPVTGSMPRSIQNIRKHLVTFHY